MATNTTNFNLSKPEYTDTADIAVINSNMDKVDTSLQGIGTGLAIISNANTHVAITSGQYVYVHGHGSLAEGLYTAKSNISANATLSTSNLQAVSGGGLNALNSNLPKYAITSTTSDTLNANADNTITIDTPGSYNEILAIVPLGYTPATSWNTRLQFTNVSSLVNHIIGARTIGSDSQKYTIRCLVVYN